MKEAKPRCVNTSASAFVAAKYGAAREAKRDHSSTNHPLYEIYF